MVATTLTSSKLLLMSKRLSKRSTIISMSWFEVRLLEMLAIAVEEYLLILLWALLCKIVVREKETMMK